MWLTFESLAHELGMPIDELLNTAMFAYARGRGYDLTVDNELDETHDAIPVSAHDRADAPDASAALDDGRPTRVPVPSSVRVDGSPTPRVKRPIPAPPRRPGLAPAPLPPRGASSSVRPPEMPRSDRTPPSSAAKSLVLTYRGRPHAVDKERFLLGRSKTQSDLRLDDPNVSRQHAVIERVGAAWYVVDLGSTNGVYVSEERVARRALLDGDVIVITTHEISCRLR